MAAQNKATNNTHTAYFKATMGPPAANDKRARESESLDLLLADLKHLLANPSNDYDQELERLMRAILTLIAKMDNKVDQDLAKIIVAEIVSDFPDEAELVDAVAKKIEDELAITAEAQGSQELTETAALAQVAAGPKEDLADKANKETIEARTKGGEQGATHTATSQEVIIEQTKGGIESNEENVEKLNEPSRPRPGD